MTPAPAPAPAPPPRAAAPPLAPTPAIALHAVSQRFGSGERLVRAVSDVSLTIGRGEVVALLGPNGAGKTTLIDVTLGLTAPSEGSASVCGLPPRAAIARGCLSAVLQTGGLLGDITVRETVEVVADFHRARGRVDEVLALADLTGLARRRVSKCSGGEQQRVKFALALLPDPDVLILDEPTAGMDVTARSRFWDTMQADANAGRTIVFATHYLEEAERFAERTVVMHRGRIVADARTASLRTTLGGRTLSATLPAGASDAHALVDRLRGDPTITELTGLTDLAGPTGSAAHAPRDAERVAPAAFIPGTRVTFRTAESDRAAAALLAAGATELEIIMPTLETAFTALTEDSPHAF